MVILYGSLLYIPGGAGSAPYPLSTIVIYNGERGTAAARRYIPGGAGSAPYPLGTIVPHKGESPEGPNDQRIIYLVIWSLRGLVTRS